MREPLVSAMMLTYNHVHHIARAIEGVMAQDVTFPFELVIGEDCSTDGTRDLVQEYQRRYPDRIRVVTSDTNVGVKQNNYRTMKACRGKYLAFCEGDDYWHHPGKLQRQVDYLEAHADCGLVFSSFSVYHPVSKVLIPDFVTHRHFKIPPNPDVWDVLTFGWILTCTVMSRRTLTVQVIEADPFLHQSEHFLMGDCQLWVEMAAIAGTHFIAESLATYTITGESASRSKDLKKVLRFRTSTAEVLIYLCRKYNAPATILAKHESAWRESALRLAFHERNQRLADVVRQRQSPESATEWLRYLGAKYAFIHYLYRWGAAGVGLLRQRTDEWR